ncbi:MAG: hypothetical protein DMF39_10065 [Verrucomicrobia bacterium]|nr:MAG: hypothetical protein DMF39_10065 [Verrucomicrobiota bacterium]
MFMQSRQRFECSRFAAKSNVSVTVDRSTLQLRHTASATRVRRLVLPPRLCAALHLEAIGGV